MIPSIKLPNTAPPLWLQHKLSASVNASSAPDLPASPTPATAQSTPAPTGAGSNALSQDVKSLESVESPAKLFTAAQVTAMVEAWERVVKAIEEADRGASKSDFCLHNDARYWPESESASPYPLDHRTT